MRTKRLTTVWLTAAISFALLALPAGAQADAPALSVTSIAGPSNFSPGDSTGAANYDIEVKNIGAAPTDGTPIAITDTLPTGVTVHPGTGASSTFLSMGWNGLDAESSLCSAGPPVTCTTPSSPIHAGSFDVFLPVLRPGDQLVVQIPVDVGPGAGAIAINHVSVSGGGAAPVSTTESTPVSSGDAPFGFQAASFSATDENGDPVTQAGAHPYDLNTYFLLNTAYSDSLTTFPSQNVKDVHVSLPPGLVVNPTATPVRCTEAQLESDNATSLNCPDASAIGLVHPIVTVFDSATPSLSIALYNMVPPPGVPAEFAFKFAPFGVPVVVHLRGGLDSAGDYELTADASNLAQFGGAVGVDLDLWGNPSDPSHDARRGRCAGFLIQQQDGTQVANADCPVNPTSTPLLTMPSACSGPLQASFSADSYDDPGNFVTATPETRDSSGTPVGVNGCSLLPFDPSLTVQPDVGAADSPAGLNVDLKVPQTNSMDTLATANLKKTIVNLPVGMAVNSSAADGLGSCSPAQVGLTTGVGVLPAHFTADPDSCPDAAKIGAVQITTPLLPDPLDGSVYLAQQNANPFPNPSLLALYITVKDPTTGIVIKLPGQVTADPQTGQLKATFDDTPQLPFSDFALQFKGGSRATLVTPPSCGTYNTVSSLSPWSAADPDNPTPAEIVTSTDSFQVTTGPGGGSCPNGSFAPTLSAGLTNPQAGSSSAFTLDLTRQDGQQNVSGVTTVLPPGLVAKLAGIPVCPDLLAATGNCAAASQIGTTTVGVGAGPTPVYIPQAGKSPTAVYLAGPYKGAPYSLVIMVPAQAGPFDLGVVTVRAGIYVNPTTAQVTVVSDPLPQIDQGIPLHYRDIRVLINRPGFIQAPTSCDPMSVGALITSAPLGGPVAVNQAGVGYATTSGTVAQLSSRFQAAGCDALPFTPKLKMSLTGKGKTNSGDHPTLTATLTQGTGQANIHDVKVALPLSLALDPNNSQHVCNYDTAQAVHGGPVGCPASTIIGTATANTPLLDKPLTGKVYLVQGIRFGKTGNRIRTLPSLLIPLRGQIALDLRAQSSVNGAQQLVTTFSTIPDAAVSSFKLQINGGPKGILVITGRGQTICGTPQITNANLTAQSGKTESLNPTMTTPCGKAAGLEHTVAHRNGVSVTIHIPGAGKLTATGQWLKTDVTRFGHAQTATVALHLTKTGLARLRHMGALQTQVALNWTPAGGGSHPLQTRVLTIRR